MSARVLWANLHLLFWLSLIPFVSGWMGENNFATLPVAIYGGVILMAAVAYTVLVWSLIALHGPDSKLASAVKSDGDIKGRASLVLYICAIPLAFQNASAAVLLYVVVAAVWFIPDRRIEKVLTE